MAWGKRRPKRRVHPYAGCKMASKAEVKFAEWMDENELTWMYEPEKFNWVPPLRTYTPDFKVMRRDGSYFFVEYKGYLRPEDKTKMAAFRKQNPDFDIRFVFMKANKPSYKGAKTTYADWAEKNGYLWAELTIPEEWLNETKPITADMMGQKCEKKYCRGRYGETSIHDDMDGVLHCEACGKSTKRHRRAK